MQAPLAERDAWDRLTPLWHGLFAATLAGSLVIALVSGDLAEADWPLALALVVGFGLWHWLVLARDRSRGERRFWLVAVYWVVACGFQLALIELAGLSFSVVLYGLYPLMMVTLGWWGLVPVVGLTALAGALAGDWSDGPDVAISVIATGAVLFGIGVVKSRWTRRRWLRSGAEILLLGAVAGIAGFLFGDILPGLLGVQPLGS